MRGTYNPDALSRHLTDEDSMSHSDRKEFMLPCKYTIAQSWAAIRRSWLGFKIAKSRGDTDKMAYYAAFILKVQSQMGIGKTAFDSAILDEQNVNKISRSCSFKKQPENRVRLEERTPDYDSMMEKARSFTNTKSLNIGPPGQNVFYRSRRSCTYLPQEKKDNLKPENVFYRSRRSRTYLPQEKKDNLKPEIASQIMTVEKNYTQNSDNAAKFRTEEENRPNYYKVQNSGNEASSREDFDVLEADGADENELEEREKEVADRVDDPCYCKAPRSDYESNFHRETQFYDDISDEKSEDGSEVSKRRSCSYKINR
jgi:hypothetical protein